MADFLLAAACFVLATVAIGLVRILTGPGDADRVMAAQLLGTGGIAVLLLLAKATEAPALTDVALVLALLAAFVSVAFTRTAPGEDRNEPRAQYHHNRGGLRWRIFLHRGDNRMLRVPTRSAACMR